MNKKEKKDCDHEFEVVSDGYSYNKDSGRVYKFFRKKCKKCQKVKIFKKYDLNDLSDLIA